MTATNPHSIKGSIAGIGAIKGVSAVGTVDFSELDAAAVTVATDSIAILTGAGATGKESLVDFATAQAGTTANSALKATNGALAVDIADVTATTDPSSSRQLLIDVAGVNKSVTVAELAKPIGAIIAATNATSALSEVDGATRVNIGGVTSKAAPVGGDKMIIEDSVAPDAGVNKSCTITQFAETLAGTVTATGIENTSGVLSVAPASLTPNATPAVGDILILADIDAANAPKRSTVAQVMETVAGAVGTTAIENNGGVLAVAPEDAAITVATDSLVFATAAGVTKKDLVSDIATAMAGTGLTAASGQLKTKYPGAVAVGSLKFGGQADCTSVTIGGIVYTYDATPDVTVGEWGPHGGTANASATALAAGINGDQRNGGGKNFFATANTDTVHVYELTAMVSPVANILRTGGTEPATMENLAGGLAAANKQWCMRAHTVTANDTDTAVLVNIPLPFAPTMFTASVRSSAGVPITVTDAFTIGTTPNRIIVTQAGAGTHLTSGDVVTITAHE